MDPSITFSNIDTTAIKQAYQNFQTFQSDVAATKASLPGIQAKTEQLWAITGALAIAAVAVYLFT